MTNRSKVREELEKVEDRYLGVLHRLIVSLERPSDSGETVETWSEFLASTYGSMADAPIARGEQGELEARGLLR